MIVGSRIWSGYRRTTLRQRVTALSAVVAAALLAVAVGAASIAATYRTDLDRLVNEINPVRTSAERLMAALVDQETAVRGYALTGNPEDLTPYLTGVANERELIAEIKRFTADEPAAGQLLRRIEQEADSWRAVVAEPIVASVRAGGPEAAQPLFTDAGRERFDNLRGTVAGLQEELRRIRDEVAQHAQSTGDHLVILLICAAVIVLLAGFALTLLLQRLVARPVTLLANDVRAVAQGDLSHEISSGSGPPELAQLASDVDAMRRKIVAELAQVRQARGEVQWINDQLRAQAEELTRSNRDLEQFAYVASHDLQEPLRKVASFCQLLQRRYAGQLDERADEYIAFAVDGAQRMQRLINDLLSFSRIGRLTAGFTEVDLNVIMAEIVTQSSADVRAGITWDELPVVDGEESLLSTLLGNLVSNSLKFRREDVPPRVHVSARQVDDEWEIAVADNGIGIDPQYADKVFVIFQRLHAKDAYPGTGIGLSIVKKIVEYHSGRVWIDPDARQGTTVRFTLPSSPVFPGLSTTPQASDGDQVTAAASKEVPA